MSEKHFKNTGAGVPEKITVQELIKILGHLNPEDAVYYACDGYQAKATVVSARVNRRER